MMLVISAVNKNQETPTTKKRKIMQLLRTEKGKNNFCIMNLSVGKLLAIKAALRQTKPLGPVGDEALKEMEYWNVDNLEPFGDNLVDKNKYHKSQIKVYKVPRQEIVWEPDIGEQRKMRVL
jgi:hypothetical protein